MPHIVENPYHAEAVTKAKARPYVFVATPLRAHPGGRQVAYEEARRCLVPFHKARIPAFCPVAHWFPTADCEGLDPFDNSWPTLNEPLLRSAAAVLVVKLAGWSESEGIKAEQKIARDCGIPIWVGDFGTIPTGLVFHIQALEQGRANGILKRDPPLSPTQDSRTAEEICAKAASLVAGERNDDYGERGANLGRIAELWSVYLTHHLGGQKLTPSDVALLMVLLKAGRMIEGRPTEDGFVDICGYAAIAGELSATEQGRSER